MFAILFFCILLIYFVAQIHPLVQDSDYLNIAAVKYSIEQ